MVNIYKLQIFLFITIIIFKYTKESYLRKINKVSIITLTINGTGEQYILNEEFVTAPSEIWINDKLENQTENYKYNLIKVENNITLVWNNISDCSNMFFNLDSIIIDINLSQFDTSCVTTMKNMFGYLSYITSLNLDNFNTSSVKDFSNMFSYCSSLKFLNLSNFDTSKASSMNGMFRKCNKLKSLDLSNFDTSSVNDFEYMFYECSSLMSLNLSNFNTSQATKMGWMFNGCYSLKSLDLSSFNTRSVHNFEGMFYNCSLMTLNLSNFYPSEVTQMINMFRECRKLESLDISNFNISSYTNFQYLFTGCPSLISIHFSQFVISDEGNCFEKILNTFNENFTICFNESNRNGSSPNCSSRFQNLYNYFGGRIVCRENSKDNSTIEYNQLCNDPCLKGTLLLKNSLCLRECHIYELFYYLCDIDSINNDNNYINKDELTAKLEKNIRDGLLNSLLSDIIDKEKQDIIIQNEDVVYQITSTENQKNNKNNNISTIELGDCENALRAYYNISDSEPLYILKVDYFKQDYLIPIIGYEVFHPENKSILDLNQCQKNNINLKIPVDIEENTSFLHDPKNDHYTDICNAYTTKNGTDILIKDRQSEFNDNKMSLCENGCELKEYDNKKAVCSCNVKMNQIEVSKLDNQADLLKYNFTDVDQSQNMAIMKCYYTLFTKEGLLNNVGNYIFLFIILLFIVSALLFYKCGYNTIENDIKEVLDEKQIKKFCNIEETNCINEERKIKKKGKKVKKGKKKSKKIKKTKFSKSSTNPYLKNDKSLDMLKIKDEQNKKKNIMILN